ncbi:hypothetical protein HGA64_04425 [Candidatus Falkowbacteria bacterium]|nr:hypothetical protein [Candidatus Falkowbacteria bacterium]
MKTDKKKIMYCNLMKEIKVRVALIRSIIQGQSLGREDFDGEMVSLQLRKCLEIVAFSSLVVNEQIYSQTYSDFSTHWKAKKIVEKIEKLNPDFFPKPIFLANLNEQGVKHFDYIKDGFLTLDELITLYDKTSNVIHSWNPYRTEPRIVDFGRSIEEWVTRLQCLLGLHIMRGVGLNEFWVVEMVAADNKVHVFSTMPVPS